MRLGAVLLTLLWVSPLWAQDVAQPGDLVTVGTCGEFFEVGNCGEYADVRWPDGSDKLFRRLRENYGAISDILYDPDGTLHTVHFLEIRTYSASFEEISAQTFIGPAALAMNEDLTLFALSRRGNVMRFPRAGAPLTDLQFPLSAGFHLASADLALDQCTMYYMESASLQTPRLKRYDVCANVPLPDVVAAFSRCFDPQVRVARDGGVFVEACSTVSRISPTGDVRTYSLPLARPFNSRSIALTPDGRSFWTIENWNKTLMEVDVETGSIVRGPLQSGSFTESMTIYGTPRAAVLANITAIPTVSRAVLVLLALTMVLMTLTRLQ